MVGPGAVTTARRARGAVALLFFTNGAIFASVVPRYPDLKDRLDLSNAALGSAVSAYWVGALALGLLGGVLISRWGSARVAEAVTVAAAANLAVVGVVPSWWALAGALFVAGSLDTLADVTENAHALRVERLYRRSILNSLHAVWSIGAVTGGLTGSLAAGSGVPLGWHLSVAGAVLAVVAVAASRFLLPGDDHSGPGTSRAAAPPPREVTVPRRRSGSRQGGRQGRRRGRRQGHRLGLVVVALGVFATLAQGLEDVAATWSPVYLRDVLAAPAALAGAGFVALQGMQTVGRLLGDRLVTRYGDRAVARAGAVLAGAGVGGALVLPSTAATVAGFGAAGLGLATLIPAAMRHADALPGLSPGVGLTLVGTVARLGSIAAAPLIGLAADAHGLRTALLVAPAAAVVLLLLAPVLPTRLRSAPPHDAPTTRDPASAHRP